MKYRSNTILVFLPKHQDGELILNQALFFKKKLGMRIFVLNILKVFSIHPHKFRIKKAQRIKNNALLELTKFVKDTIQKEIPDDVILRIKFGKTAQTLINESKIGGYEFIIIEKSKLNLTGALSKKQVNRIINRSYCPVLFLNKELPIKEINKIVVPVDITQTTKKRLLWATFFAKKFNAKVQIVSALTVNIDEEKSLAYRNAEKIKKMLTERGVESEVKVIKTHNKETHEVILDYIERENSVMVIIRTHQDTMFSRGNIGKFVSEIVQGCKVPVFAVGHSKQNLPDNFEE